MKQELPFQTTVFPARGVRTLYWRDDNLIDLLGGVTYCSGGQVVKGGYSWGYRFDSVVASPESEWCVLLERLGTKGVVLRNGHMIREINRSFYRAEAYEYPVVLFKLPNGRDVIAHCPEEHSKIELEDLQSGERLTHRSNSPAGSYHSRLIVDSTRTKLMSAGWVWHPLDTVAIYDIEQALQNPVSLDGKGVFNEEKVDCEINGAVFLEPNEREQSTRVVLTCSPQAEDFENRDSDGGYLIPGSIGVFDLNKGDFSSIVPFNEPVGTMMPIDACHVIGFYKHPKLINVFTGEVVKRWENLNTGLQNSSIIHHIPRVPPIACDIKNRRFAVAGEDNITVVTLTSPTSK